MKVQDIVANVLTTGKTSFPNKASAGFSNIMNNAGEAARKRDLGFTYNKQVTSSHSMKNNGKSVASSSPEKFEKEIQNPLTEKSDVSLKNSEIKEKFTETEDMLCGTKELLKEEEAFGEAIKLVENAMMEILTEDLQISDEELTQIMEILGLSFMELFQPKNLKQLVMELQNASDLTEVLMNDDLSTILTQVLQDITVENVAKETETPEQDIKQMILQTITMSEQAEEITTPIIKEDMVKEEAPLIVQAAQEGNGQTEDVNLNQKADKEILLGQNKDSAQESGQSSLPEVSVVKTVEEKGDLSKGNFGQDAQKQPDLAENMVNNIVSSAVTETVSSDGTMTMTTVEIRQVVVQIVQQIKVVIRPEQTDMHMTLHPEHLGKLQLAVSSKDGVMTANFVVQNEMVRHALETQMQELKDAFAEQGLKVEAVEVTVSTFEFTQGDQAGESRQQPEQKKQKGKTINMESAFLDEVDQKESEDRAAAVISGSGNNVDYTA